MTRDFRTEYIEARGELREDIVGERDLPSATRADMLQAVDRYLLGVDCAGLQLNYAPGEETNRYSIITEDIPIS